MGQRETPGQTFIQPRFSIRTHASQQPFHPAYTPCSPASHTTVGDLVYVCPSTLPPPAPPAFRVSTRSYSRTNPLGYISPHLVPCPSCLLILSLLSTITPDTHCSSLPWLRTYPLYAPDAHRSSRFKTSGTAPPADRCTSNIQGVQRILLWLHIRH